MLDSDEPAAERLLGDVPVGQYLLEYAGDWLLLWRLSEGEPADDAFVPAEGLLTQWAPG